MILFCFAVVKFKLVLIEIEEETGPPLLGVIGQIEGTEMTTTTTEGTTATISPTRAITLETGVTVATEEVGVTGTTEAIATTEGLAGREEIGRKGSGSAGTEETNAGIETELERIVERGLEEAVIAGNVIESVLTRLGMNDATRVATSEGRDGKDEEIEQVQDSWLH